MELVDDRGNRIHVAHTDADRYIGSNCCFLRDKYEKVIQWCEERMRLGCSECKEFSNLIGSQSLAAQILLV